MPPIARPRPPDIEPDDHLPEVREPGGYRRSDDDVRAEVCRRLEQAAPGADALVVTVHDGNVVLSGPIPSPRVRQHVGRQACTVAGVRSVRDDMTCPEGEADPAPRRPVGAASKMGKPGYER